MSVKEKIKMEASLCCSLSNDMRKIKKRNSFESEKKIRGILLESTWKANGLNCFLPHPKDFQSVHTLEK